MGNFVGNIMKQAILITAYKDQSQLEKLINFFSPHFLIFIHIDKKSQLTIPKKKNVYVIKKYKINWGGLDHLLAILELMRMALNHDDVGYIHIISGQDFPIKPISNFDFFNNNPKIYMQFENVTPKRDYFKNRYRKGVLFSNLDSRKKLNHLINIFYGLSHKKRTYIDVFPEDKIDIGLVWCSMPRVAADYVLKYVLTHDFPNNWKHVNIPEEFFFQTILGNSPFRENIINNNLRYMDWSQRNGSMPAYLDDTDYVKIKNSNCFFARKLDTNISKKLIELLEKNII